MRSTILAALVFAPQLILAQFPIAKVLEHPGNPLVGRTVAADVSADGRVVVHAIAELGGTLTVLNDTAGVEWSKRFVPASVDRSFSSFQVKWMPNDDILLAGYVHQLQFDRQVGLVRLNDQGDTLWTRRFRINGNEQNTTSCVIITSEGGIALLTFAHPETPTLIKLDGSGEVAWARSFPETIPYGGADIDLTECANGDLLVRSDTNIVRVDQQGELMYIQQYAIPGRIWLTPEVYFPRICALADGGFVFQSIVDHYPSLIRCDANGNIIWAKKYEHGDFYKPWFTSMHELENGDILVFPTSGWNRTVALRVDANGIPQQRYGVQEDIKLWPGSSATWVQPYVGTANGRSYFLGGVQQVYSGGFTPSASTLMILDDALAPPCVAVQTTFTATDIVGIPPPAALSTVEEATVESSPFPVAHVPFYLPTSDACSLLLSAGPSPKADPLSLYPTVLLAGQHMNINGRLPEGAYGWRIVDLAGRTVHQEVLNGAMEGPFMIPMDLRTGVYLLRVEDRDRQQLASARFTLM